jgi:predicted polyphosphate/ATP-dependent NAD kinase
MGAEALAGLGLAHEVLGQAAAATSTAEDTRRAVQALRDQGVDLILFAGGDGTARDIYDVIGSSVPVLGIPAGVKMHSGVFAVSPEAAGELLLLLVRGGLVGLRSREVRDIDEEAFRHDRVRSRFYGEMLVPGEGRYLQHTKVGGRESPELVADDIADWVIEQMEAGRTYLVGPGSTTAAIMAKLGLPNTLLGVDAVRDGELLASDADEARLLELLAEAPGGAAIVVTVIGGQGHVFGRGNQQFSPRVIRAVGLDNIIVIAAKSKIAALQGRPLLVDTNDPVLDRELCGWRTVITGYDDKILYRVATIE